MDDKLIQEITNFCKLNDIEDVEKQINACLRKGFNILKYGTSPIDNYKIEKNIYGTEDGKRDSPKEEEKCHTTDKGSSNNETEGDEQNGESNKKVVRRKVRIIKRNKNDESQ